MRLTLVALTVPLLALLTACGPQPPDAAKWQAFGSIAAGHGTATALGRRCGFATDDLDAAFAQAQGRYALTADQQSELSQISDTAAVGVAGDALPPEHALCADGKAMSLRVQDLLRQF